MRIMHKKAFDLNEKEWSQIRLLNQKIISTSLYDQRLFDGGCLKSTCESAIKKAIAMGTTEVLLGFKEDTLMSYMIFYCTDNPPSLQEKLDAYCHLGRVGYSDMLVVDPHWQKQGYSQQMRAHMKQIARKANVDVLMTFVRGVPIPNIPSLKALRQAGAVCGKNLLVLERKVDGVEEPLTDICIEMIYPTDTRTLTTDKLGKVIWNE